MSTNARAERTLELLRDILNHYAVPGRQVGHTQAALNGAYNAPGCRMVVSDERMAQEIRQRSGNMVNTMLLLEFKEQTRGFNGAIIWDNTALTLLLGRCGSIINDLLAENRNLQQSPFKDPTT